MSSSKQDLVGNSLSKSLEKALSGAVSKVISKFTDDSDLDDFEQPFEAPRAPTSRKRLPFLISCTIIICVIITTDNYYVVCIIFYRKGKAPCTLPSSFLSKRKCGNKGVVERMFTYDRDIICLPKSFSSEEGLVKIPRKQDIRDFLASNKLSGKIRLTSAMTEDEIMNEIRSVFEGPMMFNDNFKFQILQSSGGNSKSLAVPVQSSSFKWTASSIAGKNAKVPIYILANEKLKVLSYYSYIHTNVRVMHKFPHYR